MENEKQELQLKIRKGAWTTQEDDKLRDYVNAHGSHHWDTMAQNLDVGRSGNSCRLRWVNYLSPSVRREKITDEEMILILKLHSQLGNQWSKIAVKLGGRTDNDIKNFWNTRMKKEAKKMNYDVKSEEFRQIMTTRLRDRIRFAAVLPPPTTIAACSYDGGTAATVAGSSSTQHTHDPTPSFNAWF